MDKIYNKENLNGTGVFVFNSCTSLSSLCDKDYRIKTFIESPHSKSLFLQVFQNALDASFQFKFSFNGYDFLFANFDFFLSSNRNIELDIEIMCDLLTYLSIYFYEHPEFFSADYGFYHKSYDNFVKNSIFIKLHKTQNKLIHF